MTVRRVSDRVYCLSYDDKDLDLFESLWPLPLGVSYNSYVIFGDEKIILLDTVSQRFSERFIEDLKGLVDLKSINFLVSHHLEHDHSGSITAFLREAVNCKILCSPFAVNLHKVFFNLSEGIVTAVNDGMSMDIGGDILTFYLTPWLHWPDTMMSFLNFEGVLFSCDAFGSFGALNGKLFDDEIDLEIYLDEAKRYFSNIVAGYREHVIKAVEKLSSLGLNFKIIAPSHGPIYKFNPRLIVDKYVSWSKPEFEVKVVMIYGSMYGYTRILVEAICGGIESTGVKVALFDASRVNVSFILKEVLDAPVLVFGTPTYDANVFPNILNVLNFIEVKKLGVGRYASIFGCYGWGPSAYPILMGKLKNMGFNVVEPFLTVRGLPSSYDLDNAKKFGVKMGELALKFKK
ncbi:MAG: FprA family A-type flavoprotein [archaeon GBS-70-058]|nr:FprA family A-type flavoprotein [Candidatus Culexarchaeum nevadense]